MENNKDPERTVIDHNGNHLLQHAVKYNGEDRLLEVIMEEYPDAVILPNKRGELPIHQCVSQQRVNFLLQSDPYLLMYTTNEGRTVAGEIIDRLQDVQEKVDEEVQANPNREQKICLMFESDTSDFSSDLRRLSTVLNHH
jgi:hypothetical protein